MEHCRFTSNTTFIREWYPTIKASAEFFVDFLTDYKGMKVTNPTISPENTYYINDTGVVASITMGPAMDTELLWELFNEVKELNQVLYMGDDTFVSGLDAIKAALPPLKINSWGGIQEWIYDYPEVSEAVIHT